jgi:hypothetical protein
MGGQPGEVAPATHLRQELAQHADARSVGAAALGLGAADLRVARRQQRRGVALASDDGPHDGHTAGTGQRADGVMQLDIHPLQRFLHQLHPACGLASPPTDTCLRSLPTSTNAAFASKMGKCFFIPELHLELRCVRCRLGPVMSRGTQISAARNKAHQNVRLIVTRAQS